MAGRSINASVVTLEENVKAASAVVRHDVDQHVTQQQSMVGYTQISSLDSHEKGRTRTGKPSSVWANPCCVYHRAGHGKITSSVRYSTVFPEPGSLEQHKFMPVQ